MTITLNGEPYTLPENATVAELLAQLGFTAGRVAVERNLAIVARTEFATTPLQAGDSIEIVHFIGGGAY